MENHPLPPSYRQTFEKLKEHLDRAEHGGLAAQSPQFIDDFSQTYLHCVSLIPTLKAKPEWRSITGIYQYWVIQANILLYPEERTTWKYLMRFLWVQVPQQLWQLRYYHAASFGILAFAGMIGFLVVLQNFEMASVMIPSGLRSNHELEAYIFNPAAQQAMLTSGRESGLEMKTLFAELLMINNIRVAILCFVTGFLYAIPTVLILIQTGLMLGAFPALFWKGDIVGLLAWLLPHGVPEVSAIILAGGAGLSIGMAMLRPSDTPFGLTLKKVFRTATSTIFICILLLIWAGIIESFVRQSDLSNATRFAIAAGSLIPIALLFIRAAIASRSCLPTEIG